MNREAKSRLALATVVVVVVLSACGGPSAAATAYNYLPTPLPGQSAADAQATITSYNLQLQAEAQATAQAAQLAAEQTRTSELATSQAVAQVTAAAVMAQEQATGTAQAVGIMATTQAVSLEGTRQSMAFVATREAELRIGAAEQALVAAEANRLAIEQQASQAAVARSQAINRLIPWAFALVASALMAIVGATVTRMLVQSRPQPAGDAWIIRDEDGRPRIIDVTPRPRQLDRSPPQLPSGPAMPAESEPRPLRPPSQGHVLIAGETGSGKSTAMRAVLNTRTNVVVLDPHSASDDWPGATIVGAGRNFNAIRDYMDQMSEMLNTRYSNRAKGESVFPPVTVAIDEMPAIVQNTDGKIADVWKSWLREGRKVGLYLVVSTQSTRVTTLGIQGEGDVRENFAMTIVLGQLARQQFPDLTADQERPAVIQTLRQTSPVVIAADSEPLLAAPAPATAEPPANPENLTPGDRRQILDLHRQGLSLNEISRRMFGYQGGRAYYAVVDTIKDAQPSASPTHYSVATD